MQNTLITTLLLFFIPALLQFTHGRPLTYWDNLRRSPNVTFETKTGSALYQVTTTQDNTTVRLGHVVGATTFSFPSDGPRLIVDTFAHLGGAFILAIHHFNERKSPIISNLDELIGDDCNVYLTIDVRDTALSPIQGSRIALEYFGRPSNVLSEPYPIAISGAGLSSTSEAIAVLAGANEMEVLVTSSQSTSSSLDNKDKFPTFTRGIPTNRVESKAVVAYFKSLGVTHFGVLYLKDPYGTEYNRVLRNEAAKEKMTVVSIPWDHGDYASSIVGALEKLKDTQFRYFFGILAHGFEEHKVFIKEAVRVGIMGSPDHVWLFADSSNFLREDGFYTSFLNSSDASDRAVASALSGSGLVVLHFPQNEAFNQALRGIGGNREMFDYYASRFEAPELFDTVKWEPVPNFSQYAAYDALISLGLGLCSIAKEFPTGGDILRAVKSTSFLGSAGPFSYDAHTGTRSEESVKAEVINLVVKAGANIIEPSATTSALVNVSSHEVQVLSPFVYNDGTVEPPLTLPPLFVDLNLIGTGARSFGWIIAGIVILSSIGSGYGTYRYRKKNIVRVAQPVFLGLMALGTALIASTIVPMSFQEPMSQKTLDAGCRAIPWLFVMGFATAFSSLYCKLRRLNKVFRDSAEMRHVEVKARDAMLPFVVFVTINFSILLAWTIVAPRSWSRVEVTSYDKFGRAVESYGTCIDRKGSSAVAQTAFMVTLGVINFLAVVLANYQCYKSRNVPSDFNESYHITLSMLSILEGFLLGIPILFLTVGKPTAKYVIFSVLIFLLCMAILVPSFGTKFLAKKKSSRLRTSEWRRAWRDYDQASSRHITGFTGSSSSHGFGQRPSLSAQQSSVAAIRARVAEKQLLESTSMGNFVKN